MHYTCSNDDPLLYCVLCAHVCVCVCPDIEFKQGDKEHVVEVEVLFDGIREMREPFTLHLKPDENMVAETQVRNCSCPTIPQPSHKIQSFQLDEKVKK